MSTHKDTEKLLVTIEGLQAQVASLADMVHRLTGPGTDGGGSDSPIIITDGSFTMVSINDDFHPTPLRASNTFAINKSNGGTAVIRPGAIPLTTSFTILLQDTANGTAPNNTITIAGTPTLTTVNGVNFTNWVITATYANVAGNTLGPITRFDMNGGESRLAHPFTAVFGSVTTPAGTQVLSSPKNFSIHFR
jgi:hypothetical protein